MSKVRVMAAGEDRKVIRLGGQVTNKAPGELLELTPLIQRSIDRGDLAWLQPLAADPPGTLAPPAPAAEPAPAAVKPAAPSTTSGGTAP